MRDRTFHIMWWVLMTLILLDLLKGFLYA